MSVCLLGSDERITTEPWKGNNWTMVLAILWYRWQSPGGARFGWSRANSSSLDDKHCFVVDQRFVAVLSKMGILLHRVIQQCIADFPSRTSVVLAQNRFN